MVPAPAPAANNQRFRLHHLPEHVAQEVRRLKACQRPQDLLQAFPHARIVEYSSHGDWGAKYEQFLCVRLSDSLAFSFMDKYDDGENDADERGYSFDFNLHWIVDDDQKIYSPIAVRQDIDTDHYLPFVDDWNELLNPPQFDILIPDHWILSLSLTYLKWNLPNFALLPVDDQAVWLDYAY